MGRIFPGARDYTSIEIENVKNSMASSMQDMGFRNSVLSTECSIFKIPSILFRHDEKAYIPNAFSIGHLHHDEQNLKETEKIKFLYLNRLITTRALPRDISFDDLFEAVRNLEDEARKSYAVPVNFSTAVFIGMLVLDGCFIIELLRKSYAIDQQPKENRLHGNNANGVAENDPVFSRSCMLQFLHHDLLLLENQIPWTVLECLFNLTKIEADKQSLSDLVIEFFGSSFTMSKLLPVGPDHGSLHILDLLRNALVIPSKNKESGIINVEWEQIPSATNLVEAGIKFRKKENSTSILDIEFRDGVLLIPPLLIQETTTGAFRNLISFEQCYHKCTSRISSYAFIWDNLINRTEDLDILRESEVIDSWLNPEEAIKFFNRLYHDTYFQEFYYLHLCREVNKYYRSRCQRWRAMLVRNHCSSPWRIIAVLVAGSILVLTFLQTFFTIKKP